MKQTAYDSGKKGNVNMRKLLGLSIIAMIFIGMLMPISQVKADIIDDAIASGEAWLNRMYREISDSQAIMSDFPALPLRVYDETASKWYKAGQLDEKVYVETLGVGNTDKAYYWFNTDADEELNEPKLYVEYWSLSSTTMRSSVQMISCSRSNPDKVKVYLGDTYLGSCDATWTQTTDKLGGYPSFQYVTRHSIRMAEKYYRSIGQTTKANKLLNFLNAYSYNGRDSYDPLFGASNSYPDTYFTDTTTFPDPELWASLPSGSNYHPYGTRLQMGAARNFWCGSVETQTPRYDASYALHLLNKYGSSKLSEAKERLNSAGWDGFGCRRVVYVLGIPTGYMSYPTYVTAPFLAAVSKYASMTNDPYYLEMADKAAGMILAAQWKYPDSTVAYGNIYKADHVGGFKTAYVPMGSIAWQPSWTPMMESFFWILDRAGFIYLNPAETPTPIITNSECTLLCLQALRQYKILLPNRVPQLSGVGIRIDSRVATNTINTGGGFLYINRVSTKGQLESSITSTVGSTSWSKVGLTYAFTPEANIYAPKFEFAFHETGILDGQLTGWGSITAYMRLKQGANVLFETYRTLHNVGAGGYLFPDMFQTLTYNYTGTLSASTQYTMEVEMYLQCGNNGAVRYLWSPTYWVQVLWITARTYFSDDFNDNNREVDLWDTLQVNGATVNEANQQLEVTVPSGSGWAQAGYVTKNIASMNNHIAAVDVSELDNLQEMHLYIGLTKATNSDPWDQPNFYRIMKTREYNSLLIQRKIGGSSTLLYSGTWELATGKLQIEIVNGIIRFYENEKFKYAEQYALSSYNCYIYIFTSSNRGSYYGTDKFDNFRYDDSTGKWFFDNFDDGNYAGWTVYAGYWTVSNMQLVGEGVDGGINTNPIFNTDRFVQTKMITINAGNTWETAVLAIKWVGLNNQINTRLCTDQVLDLAMWKDGQKVHQTQVYTALSPYAWHTFSINVKGTNIKVWIDGTKYIDVDDTDFDDIAGSVGYQCGTMSKYDEIQVHW